MQALPLFTGFRMETPADKEAGMDGPNGVSHSQTRLLMGRRNCRIMNQNDTFDVHISTEALRLFYNSLVAKCNRWMCHV